MNKTHRLLVVAVIVLSSTLAGQATAQSAADQGKAEMVVAPAMTDGEVRKVDQAAGKITIRHGEIKHMDMPPMTMVFVAQDKAMLDTIKPGDQIRFMVVDKSGKLTVTEIRPGK